MVRSSMKTLVLELGKAVLKLMLFLLLLGTVGSAILLGMGVCIKAAYLLLHSLLPTLVP